MAMVVLRRGTRPAKLSGRNSENLKRPSEKDARTAFVCQRRKQFLYRERNLDPAIDILCCFEEYMDFVPKYFPEFSEKQMKQLDQLLACVREWNGKINLISRKDTEHIEEHHILHSLGIVKAVKFPAGSRVMDVGTGGGFPGLVLAIVYPDCQFTLVDSIGKKIMAVKDMAQQIGLKHVTARQCRAEEVNGSFDFITGRAVTRLPEFIGWVRRKISPGTKEGISRGIVYLKGPNDIRKELEAMQVKPVSCHILSEFFDEPFFAEKAVVHLASDTLPKEQALQRIAEMMKKEDEARQAGE